MAVLEIKNLRTHFRSQGRINRSVDGISFHVNPGEIIAIVGESGCGKSVTAMSILRLLPDEISRSDGEIWFSGKNLLAITEKEMQSIRGNEISMIFQEPMNSLNPVLTVGWQLAETLRKHQHLHPQQAQARALELLQLVRIAEPQRRLTQYPHELSGGMRQRVMIAMALACQPKLLVADEPTTALDVTVQAQILALLRQLRDETGAAVVLITHDLGVVAEMAERVVVMYAGRIVEEASVVDIFARPQHPYTQALMRSMPRLAQGKVGDAGPPPRLQEIPGVVPAMVGQIDGCVFAPRCTQTMGKCRQTYPQLESVALGHRVACWLAEDRSSAATQQEVVAA